MYGVTSAVVHVVFNTVEFVLACVSPEEDLVLLHITLIHVFLFKLQI